jgi:DNA-directed RNA polymerase specialized sigma subunit
LPVLRRETKREGGRMTNYDRQEIKTLINTTINETIKELKKQGLLNLDQYQRYDEAQARLFAYYQNDMQDEEITKALLRLQNDRYIDIIPLFYYAQNSIEHIASLYDVDTSTIVRNKKRLCLEISKYIT